MEKLLENFCRISLLNEREISALQQILTSPKLMPYAREIASKAFFPGNADITDLQLSENELSQAWFAAAFLSFEESKKCYQAHGFPESVWLDSMTDLCVWLRNEERNSGTIGLGPLARPWQVVIYRAQVTRHGRLECNTEFYYKHEPLTDISGNVILQRGDAVINLHIPEDGAMDMQSCGKSMKRMKDFYASCMPDYNWKGFLCESWLLDRQLRNMLSANSNIIKFQNLGQRYMLHQTDDTIFRIFGSADPFSIKNPTSLQKNAAGFLKNGGVFYEEGIFIPRSKIECVNYDLSKLHA